MIYYPRLLDLERDVATRSAFLFGPRQTGKTSLLKHRFPDTPYYNLLLSDVFLRLSQRPHAMREELLALPEPRVYPVIIDEIQKLPVLLDEVHALIESEKMRFVLTGSSPRKLRRGGYNLLGGRARIRRLYPLVSAEITDFDLLKALNVGTLPPIWQSDSPREDLIAYCGAYLQEEIAAGGAVRGIESFSRFLQTAALTSSELINFEAVARDAQVPARTIREYYAVLEDTLVGVLLHPFRRTRTRKAVSAAKCYLFDVGVTNALAGRATFGPRTELFGKALEHFVFTEIRAWLDYTRDDRPLTFWRDRYGHEVDFVLGDDTAVEVKASHAVSDKHLKGLRMLSEEIPLRHRVAISLDPIPRRSGDIDVLPCAEFLSRLWQGAYR